MNIKEIKVENFRLLKDFTLEMEDELSLIIGKNNVGKTSLLVVLDKFLNPSEQKKFLYNDFNLDFKTELQHIVEDEIITEKEFKEIGIRLRLLIKYGTADDLEYISPILMDLDVNNNFLGLGFDYVLTYGRYLDLRKAYQDFQAHERNKAKEEGGKYIVKNCDDFLEAKQTIYFTTIRKSIAVDKDSGAFKEDKYIDLKDVPTFHLNDVICFQYINAKRNVDNKDVDKTLSIQTSELYKVQETDDEQQKTIEQFQDSLKDTDNVLSSVYEKMFDDIVGKVKKFGGMTRNETVIKIVSSLQHRELLKGNTTVVYEQDDKDLPENYNGLGYMNLISMIFNIDLIVKKMQRNKDRKPADINLLFIEEPEAHTHPQMQYIFIKNIKELLKQGIQHKNSIKRELQYIISSHSSHIVSDCDFDDIKYLCHAYKEDSTIDKNGVISKNMRDLEKEYKEENRTYFAFLKQYLTLNRSELLFADKAIFIEGDTERILLPAIMKKIDQECDLEKGEEYLLSQNISIIEVGAYSHIFEPFLRFIGLRKCLIITDIDYCKPEKKPDKNGQEKTVYTKTEYSPTDMNLVTSNASIKFFLNGTKCIKDILAKAPVVLAWDEVTKKWISDDAGNLRLTFQYANKGEYHPRSFEDAFFNKNETFIVNNTFLSLDDDCITDFKADKDSYKLAQNGVKSKSSLAIEILFNSNKKDNSDFSNWEIPNYIKDGLLWLRKD
ncbi:MAG: ATP-dependent endonuclease [Bacteroidaceae bacterium]